MKSKKSNIQTAHAVQIVSNTLRIQAILEILQGLDIIDAEAFNKRVDDKYTELEQGYGERDEEEINETIIKYYGTTGEA